MDGIDYKKAYFHLFNQMTDVIELLVKAQIETEEIIISSEENSNDGNGVDYKAMIRKLEGVA